MHNYKAKVVKVVDADTIDCDIDLGFYLMFTEQRLRLHNYDAPEITGSEKEEGKQVKKYVETLLPPGKDIEITTYKKKTTGQEEKGNFGRWLCDIQVDEMDLVTHLLEKGWGKRRDKW